MTPNEYWKREIDKASELAPSHLGGNDMGYSHLVAALIIAGQLQAITTVLSEIRNKLEQIEDSINSQ